MWGLRGDVVLLAGVSGVGHQAGRAADAWVSAHAGVPHAGFIAYLASALLTLLLVRALARRVLYRWASYHEGSRTLSRGTRRQLRALRWPAVGLAYCAGLATMGAVDIAASLAATAAGQPGSEPAMQLAVAVMVPGLLLAFAAMCLRQVSGFARRDAWPG